MRWSLLPLVALAGCPWIGSGQLDERLDADGDGYLGVAVGGPDCNDDDPAIHPDAIERCDGIDDDCDGEVDDGRDEEVEGGIPYTLDADGDGFGQLGGAIVEACAPPEGFAETADDCDDGEASVHPGADERCNEVDDDCDGTVDEDPIDGDIRYVDADGDSYGDPSTGRAVCTPDGTVDNALDCNDDDAERNPDTSWYADTDGDGYGNPDRFVRSSCEGPSDAAANDLDCNDDDPTLNPDTEWYEDLDGDTFGGDLDAVQCEQPTGAIQRSGDCDDTRSAVHPETLWFEDQDGDGYTGTILSPASCKAPPGGTLVPTDCNDDDDAISPMGIELCSPAGVDEDCDGAIDADDLDTPPADATLWYVDNDHDGWGSDTTAWFCDDPNPIIWSDVGGDCNDYRSDQNPDTEWILDSDGDGYWPDSGPTITQCEQPSVEHKELQVVQNGSSVDCDDAEPTTYPGADERCDEVDSDCDGDVNDDDSTGERTWWRDDDDDGYGDIPSTLACFRPEGYADNPDDCADSDPLTYPGAPDACYDGEDFDCDGDEEDDCDGDGFLPVFAGGDDCDDLDPFVNPATPTTRSVPGDHATIQEALDAACPYDTISVGPGTWFEVLTAPRPVHLVGAGVGTTIIDGNDAGSVLSFEGGTVSDLTLRNGLSGEGACFTQNQGDPVTLERVEMDTCISTGNAGCLYILGTDYTLDDVDLRDCAANGTGGGLNISSGNGTLTDVTCTDCGGLSGGAVALINVIVDIDGLTLVRPTGFASVFLGASVGGTWQDLTLERSESITPGLLLTGAGFTAPLLVDGLTMDAPSASDGGTIAVWASGATDLTLTDVVVHDADINSLGYFPPNVFFIDVATGQVLISGVEVRNTAAPTRLTTALTQGSIVLEHATFVETEGGLILDAADTSSLVVRNTVVAYDRGQALTIDGALPTIEGTVLYGNAGGDWPGGTNYDGFDGNDSVDPQLLTWGPSLLPASWDLRLAPASPLRDAGIGLDPDGSPADIGRYGGATLHPDDLLDADADTLYDSWEVRFGLSTSSDSRGDDPDGDGLDNEAEANAGTWPDTADTDGDGLDDGAEVSGGTSPVDGSDP